MYRNIIIIVLVIFALGAGMQRYVKMQTQQTDGPNVNLTVLHHHNHKGGTVQRDAELPVSQPVSLPVNVPVDESVEQPVREDEDRPYALWLIEKWTARELFHNGRPRYLFVASPTTHRSKLVGQASSLSIPDR